MFYERVRSFIDNNFMFLKTYAKTKLINKVILWEVVPTYCFKLIEQIIKITILKQKYKKLIKISYLSNILKILIIFIQYNKIRSIHKKVYTLHLL